MVKKVVWSGDVVLEEKVPVKDVAMEAIISLVRALDACKSYQFSEINLDSIEKEINRNINDFDMFISMHAYGKESKEFKNSLAGERYVIEGIDIKIPSATDDILLLIVDIL